MPDKTLLDLKSLSVALETNFLVELFIPVRLKESNFYVPNDIYFNKIDLDEERIVDLTIPFRSYSYRDLELGGVSSIKFLEGVSYGEITLSVIDDSDFSFLAKILDWERVISGKGGAVFIPSDFCYGFMHVRLLNELGNVKLRFGYIISLGNIMDLPLRRSSNSPIAIQYTFKVNKIIYYD